MSFFVNGSPVAVSDEKGNTIWVLAKMGIGVEAKVSADYVRLGGRSIVAYQLSLLRHNIVRWDGPDFMTKNDKGEDVLVPCTPININLLSVDLPIVTATLERIGELNKAKEAPVTDEEKAADPI